MTATWKELVDGFELGEEVFKDVVRLRIGTDEFCVDRQAWYDIKHDSIMHGYDVEWLGEEHISLGRKVLASK